MHKGYTEMKDVLSNLVIKKVFSAMTIYTEKNTKMSNKRRPCWAVVIKREGETVYSQGERKYVSNIGNMVILPKGSAYEWLCIEAGDCAIIEFDADTTHDEILSFHITESEKILKIFKDLEYKRLLKQPMYEIESIRDTYSIILMLLSQAKVPYIPHTTKEKLLPAVDYMLKNYNKKISVGSLAELTGLSEVYFRKLFLGSYGVSPTVYIKKLRMKKAKEMLRTDYGSISDIATSLGYLNVYDFSRDFKKHVGVSPSKFNPHTPNESVTSQNK